MEVDLAKGRRRTSGRPDPLQRRQGETHFQWRARVAAQIEAERTRGDDVVTPETLAQGGLVEGFVTDGPHRTRTYHRRRTSALKAMCDRGNLSDLQYYAALQIARIAERIERDAAVGSASMEARVDCSGSAKDKLVESLYDVRAERAYTEWRQSLPIPRRMIVDMVTRDYRLKAIAARHNMGWPRAQRLLRNALDDRGDIFARSMRAIDQDDVDAMHARLTRAPKCA